MNQARAGSGSSPVRAGLHRAQAESDRSTTGQLTKPDVDNGATAGGSLGGVLGANVKNRSMVIRCKQ